MSKNDIFICKPSRTIFVSGEMLKAHLVWTCVTHHETLSFSKIILQWTHICTPKAHMLPLTCATCTCARQVFHTCPRRLHIRLPPDGSETNTVTCDLVHPIVTHHIWRNYFNVLSCYHQIKQQWCFKSISTLFLSQFQIKISGWP